MHAGRADSTLQRIRKVLAAELDVSENAVQADTVFSSLCSDSLELASLIIELEEAFGIAIDDPYQFPTVQHVINFVEGKT
jgi:acyl carrier protein